MDELLNEYINEITRLCLHGQQYFEKVIDQAQKIKGYAIRQDLACRQEPYSTLIIEFDDENTDLKAANQTKEETDEMQPWNYITTRPRGKNGLLEYRFSHEGERHSAYGYSKKECWQERDKVIAGASKARAHKQYNFEIIIKEWYSRYRQPNQSLVEQGKAIRHIEIICAAFGKKDIRRITTDELQDFANSMNDKGRKRDIIMGIVKAVFEKHTPKIVKYNPCKDLAIVKHKSKHYPVIQLADQRRIFESDAPEIYKKAFLAYCCTGARLNEFFSALPHIDFENNIFYFVGDDTKTKKHKGDIPFLPELLTPDDRNKLMEITPRMIQKNFVRLFDKLNIKAVVHSFRVTFISCCFHLKFNMKQIQEWARHEDWDMTINTYAKLLKVDGTSPILEYLKRLKEKVDP